MLDFHYLKWKDLKFLADSVTKLLNYNIKTLITFNSIFFITKLDTVARHQPLGEHKKWLKIKHDEIHVYYLTKRGYTIRRF